MLYDCPIPFAVDTVEFRSSNGVFDIPGEMPNTQMLRICEERCLLISSLAPAGIDRSKDSRAASSEGRSVERRVVSNCSRPESVNPLR